MNALPGGIIVHRVFHSATAPVIDHMCSPPFTISSQLQFVFTRKNARCTCKYVLAT